MISRRSGPRRRRSLELPGMGPIDIETEETTGETIELTYAASVE